MSALAIVVYCFCGLIPLSAILSQFIGNHKKCNIGRFVTSFLALVTGALLGGLNQMWLEVYQEPATFIIIISIIISLIVIGSQLDYPKFFVRPAVNLCGLGGVFCLLFFMMMMAMWTGGYVETKHFQEETTQEGRNKYYTQKEFEREFGFSLPKFELRINHISYQ